MSVVPLALNARTVRTSTVTINESVASFPAASVTWSIAWNSPILGGMNTRTRPLSILMSVSGPVTCHQAARSASKTGSLSETDAGSIVTEDPSSTSVSGPASTSGGVISRTVTHSSSSPKFPLWSVTFSTTLKTPISGNWMEAMRPV